MDGKTLFDLHRNVQLRKVYDGPEIGFFTYKPFYL